MHKLVKLIRLSADRSLQKRHTPQSPFLKRVHLLQGDKRRPLEELLMEQIEVADLLLLNKTDQVAGSDAERLESYLRSLNDHAEVHRCAFGAIDAATLFGKERFDEEATLGSAHWRNLILTNERQPQEPMVEPHPPQNLSFDSFTPAEGASSGSQSRFSLQPARQG
ncbi:MAG: GTP-binding protein [Verrucomicrobiota bacterium]